MLQTANPPEDLMGASGQDLLVGLNRKQTPDCVIEFCNDNTFAAVALVYERATLDILTSALSFGTAYIEPTPHPTLNDSTGQNSVSGVEGDAPILTTPAIDWVFHCTSFIYRWMLSITTFHPQETPRGNPQGTRIHSIIFSTSKNRSSPTSCHSRASLSSLKED